MITLTTEQAQQIEEALESVHGLSGINMSKPLATIREQKAELEKQEPIGFVYGEVDGDFNNCVICDTKIDDSYLPVYLTAPVQPVKDSENG